MKLLDWANENYERMERVSIDTAYHDFAVDLRDEELSFVTVSVHFSGMENGAYGQYLPQKIKEYADI